VTFRRNLDQARVTGLEPAASSVTGWRSNQLSYTPNLLPRCGLRRNACFCSRAGIRRLSGPGAECKPAAFAGVLNYNPAPSTRKGGQVRLCVQPAVAGVPDNLELIVRHWFARRRRRCDDSANATAACNGRHSSNGYFDMWTYYKESVDLLFKLDSQEWFLAMCAALVIGFFALRGFGSRSNY
jgi:hypothetical protein